VLRIYLAPFAPLREKSNFGCGASQAVNDVSDKEASCQRHISVHTGVEIFSASGYGGTGSKPIHELGSNRSTRSNCSKRLERLEQLERVEHKNDIREGGYSNESP
jgi:hypothetical protein